MNDRGERKEVRKEMKNERRNERKKECKKEEIKGRKESQYEKWVQGT